MKTRLELEKRLILLTLVGSRCYGTDIEGSDYDYKGICIANKDFYLGLNNKPLILEEENQIFNDGEPCVYPVLNNSDTVIYELSKFIGLLLTNNPNSFDLLWAPSYVYLHPIAQELVNNRSKFISKRVKHTYTQYAKSQVALSIRLGGPSGYKPKPMSHAIRLYKMGLEIIKDGVVKVDRRAIDAQYLKDIRLGNASLDSIKYNVAELEEEIEDAYKSCTLQDEPNVEFINDLKVSLLERYLYDK